MIKILQRSVRSKLKSDKLTSGTPNIFKPSKLEAPDRNLYELMKSRSEKLMGKFPIMMTPGNNLKIFHHYYKGCDITVCGSEANTYNTATSLVEFFEEESPIQFILDMNEETLQSYSEDIFKCSPIDSVPFNSILGRKQALQFLCNDMYFSKHLLKDSEDPIVLKFKEKVQMLSADMDLTAMHTASLFSIAKLFFAKPPELLLLEDIALNFSLPYLKHVFYEVLKNLNKENIPQGNLLPLSKDDILEDIRANTHTLFGKTLFKKKGLYQCAVMERFLRPSEKTLIHTDYDQAVIISKLM